MKNQFIFFVFLCSLLLNACTQNDMALTTARKAEIEKEIHGIWDNLGKTLEKADADGYLSFFSTDGFVSMASEGIYFNAREEYADSAKTWFRQRTGNHSEPKSLTISVLSSELALLDQSSIFQADFKDGGTVRINHVVSFLFRKEANGWKIIHGHESWKSN